MLRQRLHVWGLLRFLSKDTRSGRSNSGCNIADPPSVPLILTTTCSYSNYSAHENSRHMQKLLNKKGGKTTKKRWYEPHFAEPLELTASKARKGPSQRQLARVRQVGHVLYDKISHLINSGELCQDLLEKQINITSVKVHNDMNGINVYWEADRSDWEEIEKALDAKRGKLRSLLISYHVLGRIPAITFVKAKQFNNMSQLSHLLEVADYGPDYKAGKSPKEIHSQQQETNDKKNTVIHHPDDIEDKSLKHHYCEESHESIDSHTEHCAVGNSVENSQPTSTMVAPGINAMKLREENAALSSPPNLALPHEEKAVEESHSDVSVLSELNFRSDLYGLQRDDMMKKIVAKKGLAPVVPSDAQEMESMSLRINSIIKKSSLLNKAYLKQKTRQTESKMKSKLLDRDASDFF